MIIQWGLRETICGMVVQVDLENDMSWVCFGFMLVINRTNAFEEGQFNTFCKAKEDKTPAKKAHFGILVGQKLLAVMPPSTDMICPVMYEAAGKQRNATKDETSSGSATRLRGVREVTSSRNFLSSSICDQEQSSPKSDNVLKLWCTKY